MMLSAWGSPEIPSGQSKSCMHIKVSIPVLFGTISNRPAFELAHSLGPQDGPAASPSPSGIHQLLRDPRQIPAPLPGDSVRKVPKDSQQVDD